MLSHSPKYTREVADSLSDSLAEEHRSRRRAREAREARERCAAKQKEEWPERGTSLAGKKRDGETARILFAIKARDNLKAITITHSLRVRTLLSSPPRSRFAITRGPTVSASIPPPPPILAAVASRIVLRDRACSLPYVRAPLGGP